MTDLILSTRLQILRRNLETVAHVGARVADNRAGVRRVTDFWFDDTANRLLKRLDRAVETLLDERDKIDPIALGSVVQIQQHLAELREALAFDEIVEIVRPWNERAAGLREDVLRRPMETYLQSSAERKLSALDALEGDWQQALNDPVGHPDADREAWAAYLELLPQAEAIFGEYVDFLGGLALRDSGYDQGICQLADELLRAILRRDAGRTGDLDNTWNSFTVPANHDVLDATVARIVRVGFPEWSIWSLPLTAHGLFTVLLANEEAYQDRAKEVGADRDPHIAVLLADAMATFVMGPAYAGSILLFRLDPRGTAGRDTRDASLNEQRSRVVFRTLERLGFDTCTQFAQRLQQAWDAALLRTARVEPLAKETELLGAGADLAPAAVVPKAIATVDDTLLGRIVDTAASQLRGKEFGDESWQMIARWAQLLRDGRPLERSVVDVRTDPLRQLLNAAWIARVMTATDSAQLTDSTEKHWIALAEVTSSQPAPPPSPPGGVSDRPRYGGQS